MIGHRVQQTGSLWELLNLGALVETAWVADAVCAQTDPEVFFPEKGESTRLARAVCRVCPVRPECLDFAVRHGEQHGVWGGLTLRERRLLRIRVTGEVAA